MQLITEPRLGQKYLIVPTSEFIKQSGVDRFLPKEGIEAPYDEFYHSRFLEGAILPYAQTPKTVKKVTDTKEKQ